MTGATATSRDSTGNRDDEPEVLLAPAKRRAGMLSNAAHDQSQCFAAAKDSCDASEPRVEWGPSEAMRAVASFHVAFGLARQPWPNVNVSDELAQLRVDLLVEEVGEFADATRQRDIAAMADALGDIVYVAYGAAVTYGIDLDAVLAEIHRSNMSKLGADGRPLLREDGKVLKSSRYQPPDVARVLAEQPELPLSFDAPSFDAPSFDDHRK